MGVQQPQHLQGLVQVPLGLIAVRHEHQALLGLVRGGGLAQIGQGAVVIAAGIALHRPVVIGAVTALFRCGAQYDGDEHNKHHRGDGSHDVQPAFGYIQLCFQPAEPAGFVHSLVRACILPAFHLLSPALFSSVLGLCSGFSPAAAFSALLGAMTLGAFIFGSSTSV